MKIQIIEYDDSGKTIKRWNAELGFASSQRGKPITVDWSISGKKTRFIGVYIPIKQILKLLIDRFVDKTKE